MRSFADLAFPGFCLGCSAPAAGGLCLRCLDEAPPPGPACCLRCGAGTTARVTDCLECRNRDFSFDAARQACSFEGVVRAAILRLKYRGERELAAVLASRVSEEVPWDVDLITWIPMDAKRVRQRGFDHGRLLAELVADRLGSDCPALLGKTRATIQQVGLEPEVRRRNLRGAFRSRLPSSGTVLIVDDVYTTGASASEAAKAVKASGAERVFAVAVARTPRRPYRV